MHYVCRGKHGSGSSTRETRRSEVAILSSAYLGSGQKRSKRQTKTAGKVYVQQHLFVFDGEKASFLDIVRVVFGALSVRIDTSLVFYHPRRVIHVLM